MKLKNLISLILLFSSLSVFHKLQYPTIKNIPINVVAPASGADNKTLSDLKNIKTLNLNMPTKCLVKVIYHF